MDSNSSRAADIPPAQDTGGSLSETRPGWWHALGGPGGTLPTREVVLLVLAFLGLVLVWCVALTWTESALGLPLEPTRSAATTANYLDVPWHLGTGAVIALAVARRKLYLALPALSLGLDIDHLFGSVFPAPFGREAHDLFFVALAAGVFYAWGGRFTAGVVSAAWAAHVSVDGGSFPLLAPWSAQSFTLPYAAEVAGIGIALLLAFLAVRPARELPHAKVAIPLILAWAGLALLLLFLGPGFATVRAG
jgi:hypothetical protein